LISKIIRQGQVEGYFKKNLDPELVAIAFIAQNEGNLNQWVLNKDRIDGRSYTKIAREILFKGLLETPKGQTEIRGADN
jgi:hypothetical protein